MLRQSSQNSNLFVLYEAGPQEETVETQEQVILVDEISDSAQEYPINGNFCYYCGPVPKEFSVRSSLFRHFRSVHPDVAEQEIERLSHRPKNSPALPFHCQLCGKTYTLKNLLVRHLKELHPHEADQAIEHMKDQRRKHGCEVCGMRFNLRIQLLEHRRINHPDFDPNSSKGSKQEKEKRKQIGCKEEGCAWIGSRKGDLRIHLEAAHGIAFETIRDKAFANMEDFKWWCHWVENRPGQEVRLRGGPLKGDNQHGSYRIYKECHTNQPKRGNDEEDSEHHCTLYIQAVKNGSDGSVVVQHACLTHYGHDIGTLPETSLNTSTASSSSSRASPRRRANLRQTPGRKIKRAKMEAEPEKTLVRTCVVSQGKSGPITVAVYKNGSKLGTDAKATSEDEESDDEITSPEPDQDDYRPKPMISSRGRKINPRKRLSPTPDTNSKSYLQKDPELDNAVDSIQYEEAPPVLERSDMVKRVAKRPKTKRVALEPEKMEKLRFMEQEIAKLSNEVQLLKRGERTSDLTEILRSCELLAEANLSLQPKNTAISEDIIIDPDFEEEPEGVASSLNLETDQSDNVNNESFY